MWNLAFILLVFSLGGINVVAKYNETAAMVVLAVVIVSSPFAFAFAGRYDRKKKTK
jgi:hypothetical protein